MERLNDIPVRYVKGIGPKRAEVFAEKGVRTLEDLFYFFPRRYEDRTSFSPIAGIRPGEAWTVKAEVRACGQRRSFRRRRFSITEAIVEDDSGRLSCVWFNQPYIAAYLKPETPVILHGTAELYSGKLQFSNPEFELVDSEKESLSMGRIVPVYPALKGMGQRSLRKMMRQALDNYGGKVREFLPEDIVRRHGLAGLAHSFLDIHFPSDEQGREQAYRRLSFEEFFLFQLPLALRKIRKKTRRGISHTVDGELSESFLAGLPFSLTVSQRRVLDEIRQDMASEEVMHRLLQGDVGSGKTVVAGCACIWSVQGGHQAAIMVPTEILARQHYKKLSAMVAALPRTVTVALLAQNSKENSRVIRETAEGAVDILVGTHAVIEESVRFRDLGLAVIDEQHKFGVSQRSALGTKGTHPDVLIMTATPIPRTLAITLYGDLDISVIRELPPGRKPVATRWIRNSQRDGLYTFLRQQAQAGRQIYVVYPLIEESLSLDLAAASSMYEEFRALFPEFRVGLLHGKLKREEQRAVMEGFASGAVSILVATTILEVGIDVPNASVMVIEHAERFGLSQLHQLRGRVGRGKDDAYCFLVSDSTLPETSARLEAMVAHTDGFRIAEEDLKIRGPGEYFGTRQHGLTGLRIGNPLTQMKLLKHAREEALRLAGRDPQLKEPASLALKEKLRQRFPGYETTMMTG